jgi:acetylornithine deacetylase/succinyl-diaminopimelate desuccinylase-like protein
MAHQDVVPVLPATEDKWTYPPFSAHFDGRYIWGRGASDCKNNLVGILEAFETLLEKGFTPERSVLAAFGFDEEISGPQGAKYLAAHIEKARGKDSIELIIDEGGLGFKELYGALFALPAVGEKGESAEGVNSSLLTPNRLLRRFDYRGNARWALFYPTGSLWHWNSISDSYCYRGQPVPS